MGRRSDAPQYLAHQAVAKARAAGTLASPHDFACTDCHGAATEYDHRDYFKPLEVEPVCRRCNLRRGPAIGSSAKRRATVYIVTRGFISHAEVEVRDLPA